jgi:hypothetical protein
MDDTGAPFQVADASWPAPATSAQRAAEITKDMFSLTLEDQGLADTRADPIGLARRVLPSGIDGPQTVWVVLYESTGGIDCLGQRGPGLCKLIWVYYVDDRNGLVIRRWGQVTPAQ